MMPLTPMILHADGRGVERVMPANGKTFSLKELQGIVGGYIEVVQTAGPLFIVLNEEGKNKGLPLNLLATHLYRYGREDNIVGDVLLTEFCYLGGDDDDE